MKESYIWYIRKSLSVESCPPSGRESVESCRIPTLRRYESCLPSGHESVESCRIPTQRVSFLILSLTSSTPSGHASTDSDFLPY